MNPTGSPPGGKKRTHADISSSQSSHGSPPRKTPRTATVPYPATSEEHRELDQVVLNKSSVKPLRYTDFHEGPAAAVLLSAIVKSSPNLDQMYIDIDEASTLIEQNTFLGDELKEAWGNKSFASIRNLALLQPQKQTTPPKSRIKSQTSTVDEMKATRSAWRVQYQGNSGDLLRRTIGRMNATRGDDAYADYLPIVQSSGTGKSRMVDEVAKKLFTIPFNLREDANGFPGPDIEIRRFFIPRVVGKVSDQKETFDEALRRFSFFFRALFETVREAVEQMDTHDSPESLASHWRDKLSAESFRNTLYDTVIRKANTAVELAETRIEGQQPREKHVRPDDNPEFLLTIKEGKKLVQSILKASNQSKRRKITEGGIPDVPLVIYFDESQSLITATLGMNESHTVLTGRQGESQGTPESSVQEDSGDPLDILLEGVQRNAYQALCSTLNVLRKVDLFAIFLSTNSSLAHFAPAQKYFWSARYRQARIDTVQAPFVETPFDTWHHEHLLREGAHLLAEVGEPKFMVRFGRPLFWTRYDNDPGSGIVQQDIINFAQMKLMAHAPRDGNDDGYLAALSVRLLLEFEPRRVAAVEAENRLVEGHLRIAYSVPAHREYLRSGTPSEPIIAEAAARALGHQVLPLMLSKHVDEGLIGKGERGELVARLLLTLAHDSAVKNALRGQPKSKPLHFSTPVPVTTFLRALFSDRFIESILDCQPDNEHDGKTLREAFEGAYVHFTHFAKAGDSSVVSDNQAWVALCRGIAWQCHDQQPSIDMLTPIALRSRDKLCRWNVSGIAWSIKDRRTELGAAQTHIDLPKMKFFSPRPTKKARASADVKGARGAKGAQTDRMDVEDKDTEPDFPSQRPYIAITMQLGVQPKQPPAGKGKGKAPEPSSPPPSARPPPVPTPSKVKIVETEGPQTRGREHVEHPRYNITAIGCSDHVYRVIHPDDKDTFAQLLASRSLLDEHPRQEDDNLEAVRRLKPFWKAGPGTYHGIMRAEEVESDKAAPPPDLEFEGDVIATGG